LHRGKLCAALSNIMIGTPLVYTYTYDEMKIIVEGRSSPIIAINMELNLFRSIHYFRRDRQQSRG